MPRNPILNDKRTTRPSSNKPRNIMLVPLHNMIVRNHMFEPRLLKGTYRRQWRAFEEYCYEDLMMEQMPCHYFVEFLDRDYVAYVAAPLTTRVSFAEILSDAGAIDYQHRHDIVVVIAEDFRLETADRRMLQFVMHTVVSPIMKIYGLGYEKVKLVDRAWMSDSAPKRALLFPNELRRFQLDKSKYWDPALADMVLKNFKK